MGLRYPRYYTDAVSASRPWSESRKARPAEWSRSSATFTAPRLGLTGRDRSAQVSLSMMGEQGRAEDRVSRRRVWERDG